MARRTPDSGPDVGALAGELLDLLLALVRRTAVPGMSLTAAATLSGLARSGPTPLTALAQRQGVTQPAMTQLVSRLERAGLVARAGSGRDRRVVLVEVTPAGLAAVEERRSERARLLSALLEELPDDGVAALAAALPALRHLDDVRPERAAGMNTTS